MKRVFIVLMSVSLSACQGVTSLPGSSPRAQIEASARTSVGGDQTCLDVISRHSAVLRRAGSVQDPDKIYLLPRGHWHYGPQNVRVKGGIDFHICDYNYFNVPVPDGYTAVWFGGLHLCNDACTFTFGTFDTDAVTFGVVSNFVAGLQYSLYAYTANGKQLIESYAVGTPAHNRLTFATPLENGFVWPLDDYVVFEIVTPS